MGTPALTEGQQKLEERGEGMPLLHKFLVHFNLQCYFKEIIMPFSEQHLHI